MFEWFCVCVAFVYEVHWSIRCCLYYCDSIRCFESLSTIVKSKSMPLDALIHWRFDANVPYVLLLCLLYSYRADIKFNLLVYWMCMAVPLNRRSWDYVNFHNILFVKFSIIRWINFRFIDQMPSQKINYYELIMKKKSWKNRINARNRRWDVSVALDTLHAVEWKIYRKLKCLA